MPLSPDWEDPEQPGNSREFGGITRPRPSSRFIRSNDSARCENILLKVLNREHSGYFSTGLNKRSHREAFREVPSHLSFCLKEIVPYCYLQGHVFMGLSTCGQFLLSYKASCDYDEVITNEYNFSSNYKYELYFWIYRPHFLLSKYFHVCLFDDHGVDDIKTVSITQWKTDQRLLIVHGASEKEDQDSYVTVVRVPKLGCMDCKQMRDADEEDASQGSLCISCNMTIHTKYRNSDSGPKFNPRYNLNCPGYIIMSENSFIHTICIQLDLSRCPQKVPSGVISSKYISKYQRMSPEVEIKLENLVDSKPLASKPDPPKPSMCETFPVPILPAPSQSLSIADQIIADFAEYETETFESKCSQTMHLRTTSRLSSSSSSSSRSHSTAVAQCPENFDELVITCDHRGQSVAIAPPRSSVLTRGAAARLSEALSPSSNIRLMNHRNNTNIELRLTAAHRTSPPDAHKSYVTRVELSAGPSSPGASPHPSAANSCHTQSPLESSGATPSSSSSSSTGNGRTPLRRRSYLSTGSRSADPNVPNQADGGTVTNDVAAKAYEFSEDNERCEKISIFRKRRLADKKYEFSEDSSHGDNVIVPFNRLRNQIRTRSASQALICSPSHSGYEMTTHLHRASPNHGFRSPCGSPVGNRYLRSPPGIRSPNYYRHHSPVGTPRPQQTPQQSAAQLIKMANFDPKDYIYPGGGAAGATEDIPKFFIDAIQKFNEKKLQADEGNNENFNTDNLLPLKADLTGFGCNGTTVQETKPGKKPTCTKKIVKIFVEEDDANSVLTTEEDDCISPGYHASLPMEVHGSCYANMQIVSPASYQKLNCPAVVVTQNSFDMEAFSFHVANYICAKHDKKYGILFDSAYELTHLLPPWDVTKQGMLSFKFRTNEPNGLIILNTVIRQPRPDFFAVELLNGHIYIHMELGSGAVKVRASRRRVDDGVWHELSLRRNGREGKVGVDGQWNDFRTPGDSTQLELDSPMYVGGIGPPYADVVIPPAIWTATLRQGFVGCLRDLVLSGKPVDIAAYARQQDSGAIKPSCHIVPTQCGGSVSPCQNGGQCTEGWNRPLCDCSATLFTGPTCGRESATLAFNGSQHMAIWIGGTQGTRTQTEELVIRFKTSRPAGLLLLTSAETSSSDRLEIGLVAGRVRANVKLGEREKNLLAGQGVLNDNNWHTVRFSRRASNLRLQVDGAPPVRGTLSEAILGRHSTLEVKSLHLGGLFHAEEEIQMTAAMPNFVGQLQGFVYNGHRYIDLVKTLGPELSALPTTTFKLTARFINSPPGSPYLPATFRSKHSYVGLPMLKAYSSVFIDFRFKTLEPNGLLFYNGGKRSDFVAVELVNGHIHYVFDLGDGPITIRDKARIHMNDNRWHSVSIRRPGPKTHTLAVDESIEIYTASGNNMHLELEGILYVGGVFKDMYSRLPSSIASRTGFEGCMASVDLADTTPSLTEDAVVPSSLVVSGCEGPTKCSQNACANRGICVQQWNAYACECDMTSFTGPTCYDESISYEFGTNKGLIQYTFPPGRQPDTEEDNIALGFVTTKSDAVLLRIESLTTQDYIEMEIVEGNVFIVYNVGSHDLPLGEIGVKVNDNNYHIVRFTRTGANASLQIDDYNVQTLSPTGHQSTTFTSMSNVQVGGKISRNGRSRIERPFSGVIAGLSVNRLRVLDLAAERDPHINMRGDVQLVTGVLDRNDQRMQQTPASGYPGVIDDLIFSGAGSGCRGDDEDECTPPFETGSGDDIITPVYVPPTKQTTAAAGGGGGSGAGKGGRRKDEGKLCDDEDCIHGSGSGEVTEVFTASTAKSSETSPEVTYTTVDFDKKTDGSTTLTTQGRSETYAPSETTREIDTTSSGTTSYGSSSSGTSGSSYGTTVSIGTTGTTSGTSSGTSSRTTYTTGTTSGSSTYGSTTQQQTPSETTVSYRDRDRDHIRETTQPQAPTTTDDDEIIEVRGPDDEDGSESQPPYKGQRKPPPIKVVEPPNPEPEPPYNVHPPAFPPTRVPKHKGGRINSEAEERTAMIIGIVAGALIAVILVILLVLWIKSNGDRSYKTEHDKSGLYGTGPSAALLGGAHTNAHNAHYNTHQQQPHHQQPPHYNGSGGGGGGSSGGGMGHHSNGGTMPLNGSLRHHHNGGNGMGGGGGGGGMGMGSGGSAASMGYNGSDRGSMQSGGMGPPPKPKNRNSKDIKEWYV